MLAEEIELKKFIEEYKKKFYQTVAKDNYE